jgi:transposase-like protein
MTTFIPFCPNASCIHHRVPEGTYTAYSFLGYYCTKAHGKIPRFICSSCGRTFSAQTFSLSYYLKKAEVFAAIDGRLCNGEGIRAIGRELGQSCASISNRIGRMARNCTAMHEQLTKTAHCTESLAADGFESFCCSQYFPNNIHLLAGRDSQFVFCYDHVTMRRKGRMTETQKQKRADIDRKQQLPVRGIEKSFRRVLDEGIRISHCRDYRKPVELWTDEKQEYRRVLLRGEGIAAQAYLERRLIHRTISSKAARTRDNPLWAVNYLDRELRKDLKEHVRQTVCWGRNVNNQMERLSVYLWHHNYQKPFRIGERGEEGTHSHAQQAGYDKTFIQEWCQKIWTRRVVFTRSEYGELATMTWKRLRMTPLKKSPEYLPLRVAS